MWFLPSLPVASMVQIGSQYNIQVLVVYHTESIAARRGMGLIWYNDLPDASGVDPGAQHAGCEVRCVAAIYIYV